METEPKTAGFNFRLPADLAADFERICVDERTVSSELRRLIRRWLRKRFYAALERAGLRRIRFHDLRHALGTAAIQKLDPYAVQSYMGHQHYSTPQRYLHHKPRREDAAVLAEAFGSHGICAQRGAGGVSRLRFRSASR